MDGNDSSINLPSSPEKLTLRPASPYKNLRKMTLAQKPRITNNFEVKRTKSLKLTT
jgi:hypothetical protein